MNRCFWKEDPHGTWWTDCGEGFEFSFPGGPRENKMEYCCYCGRKLEDLPFIELVEPEDD